MSATIQWHKNYDREITYIEHGSSLGALTTYVSQLHPYSNAAITKISFTVAQGATLSEGSGDYASVDMQAKILLRDTATNKLWGVMIPAPVSSMFEEIEGEGLRVKQAVGEQIAQYYAAYSGLTVEFDSGWLVANR